MLSTSADSSDESDSAMTKSVLPGAETNRLGYRLKRLEVPESLNIIFERSRRRQSEGQGSGVVPPEDEEARIALIQPECQEATSVEHNDYPERGGQSAINDVSLECPIALPTEGLLNSTMRSGLLINSRRSPRTLTDTFGEIIEWAFDISQDLLHSEINRTQSSHNFSVGEDASAKDESWEGFLEAHSNLDKLAKLQDHLRSCRDINNHLGRGDNNQIIREVWKGDYRASETRLRPDISVSDSEVFSTPRRILDLGYLTPRFTRSRGTVRDLPRVQPRVLEYKTKKPAEE